MATKRSPAFAFAWFAAAARPVGPGGAANPAKRGLLRPLVVVKHRSTGAGPVVAFTVCPTSKR